MTPPKMLMRLGYLWIIDLSASRVSWNDPAMFEPVFVLYYPPLWVNPEILSAASCSVPDLISHPHSQEISRPAPRYLRGRSSLPGSAQPLSSQR